MKNAKGALYGANNRATGYFQNVRNYVYTEAKFKSIITGNPLGKAQAIFDLRSDFSKMGVNALN